MLKRYESINKAQVIPEIKNIVAIASGKGGVGKSTIAFNIAAMAHAQGLSVGLVDADIYGPSLAHLSGISDRASVRHDKSFEPHLYKGMPVLSIAHLVDKEQALAWRGPMASGAIMQLITQTTWPPLDILFIDMPPGTGDIHLTLGQKIPLTGACLVTTPHPLSVDDYIRGKSLYSKLKVPILGTVINYLHNAQVECGAELREDALGILEYSEDVYHSTANSRSLIEGEKGFISVKNILSSLLKSMEQLPLPNDIPFKVC